MPVPSHFSPLFKFFKRIKILFIYLYIYIQIQVLNLLFQFFMMNFITELIFQNQVNFMINFTIKIITCFCCMLFFPTNTAYQEVHFCKKTKTKQKKHFPKPIRWIFIFNWRIIVLHHCVGNCCTTTWISHKYTNIPSILSLPRPLYYPSRSSQSTRLGSLCYSATSL